MGTRNPLRWIHGSVLLTLALATLAGCAARGKPGLAKVSAEDERQAVAHYNLGVHHLSQGNSALAIRELQAAVARNPNDPSIHLALAAGYRGKAKLAECEQHLKRALELEPTFHNARLNLSGLYVQTGRHEEAIAEAAKLVDDPTFPTPWRALTNLGYAKFKLGRVSEARSHLELALEYRPYDTTALLNLAQLESDAGQKLRAIELYKKVLSHKPSPLIEAEANFRLAEVYVSLGRRNDALAHLSDAVAARPGSLWAKRSEEYRKLLQ